MKTSKETKLSNSTKIDFDLEENISDDQLEEIYGGKKEIRSSNLMKIDFDLEESISDDQLEKIYGGKIATFTLSKQDISSLRRPRFRDLWYLFSRCLKI